MAQCGQLLCHTIMAGYNQNISCMPRLLQEPPSLFVSIAARCLSLSVTHTPMVSTLNLFPGHGRMHSLSENLVGALRWYSARMVGLDSSFTSENSSLWLGPHTHVEFSPSNFLSICMSGLISRMADVFSGSAQMPAWSIV